MFRMARIRRREAGSVLARVSMSTGW
jgi:hypothetical protein